MFLTQAQIHQHTSTMKFYPRSVSRARLFRNWFTVVRNTARSILVGVLIALMMLPMPLAAVAPDNWMLLMTNVKVDAGRAGHTFKVLDKGGVNPAYQGTVGLRMLYENTTPAPYDTFTKLGSSYSPLSGPAVLKDMNTGETIPLVNPPNGASLVTLASDLRNAAWTLPPGGVSKQFFVVPLTRKTHTLAISQADGTFSLLTVNAVSMGNSGTPITSQFGGSYANRFEGSVPYTPGQAFKVVDLTTFEQSATGEVNLALCAWTPLTMSPAVGEVTILLDTQELGHRFTFA